MCAAKKHIIAIDRCASCKQWPGNSCCVHVHKYYRSVMNQSREKLTVSGELTEQTREFCNAFLTPNAVQAVKLSRIEVLWEVS